MKITVSFLTAMNPGNPYIYEKHASEDGFFTGAWTSDFGFFCFEDEIL